MRVAKKYVRYGLILLAFPIMGALLMLLMTPGLHDFCIKLPNGYELFRPYVQGNCIVDSESSVVIGEFVDRYRVIKHLVVGHVSPGLSYPGDTEPQEATGYFILDTKTGNIEKGMTKRKWMSSLKARGILSTPKLWKPNILLAWLSKIGII